MKTILFLILFCLIAYTAYGELTKEDLQELESIIEKSEERTKQHINSKINESTIKIEEMDKRLTAQIDNMDKRFVDMRHLLMALMALLGAVIIVPIIYLAKLYHQAIQNTDRAATNSEELVKHAREVHNDAKESHALIEDLKNTVQEISTRGKELFDEIEKVLQEKPRAC